MDATHFFHFRPQQHHRSQRGAALLYVLLLSLCLGLPVCLAQIRHPGSGIGQMPPRQGTFQLQRPPSDADNTPDPALRNHDGDTLFTGTSLREQALSSGDVLGIASHAEAYSGNFDYNPDYLPESGFASFPAHGLHADMALPESLTPENPGNPYPFLPDGEYPQAYSMAESPFLPGADGEAVPEMWSYEAEYMPLGLLIQYSWDMPPGAPLFSFDMAAPLPFFDVPQDARNQESSDILEYRVTGFYHIEPLGLDADEVYHFRISDGLGRYRDDMAMLVRAGGGATLTPDGGTRGVFVPSGGGFVQVPVNGASQETRGTLTAQVGISSLTVSCVAVP